MSGAISEPPRTAHLTDLMNDLFPASGIPWWKLALPAATGVISASSNRRYRSAKTAIDHYDTWRSIREGRDDEALAKIASHTLTAADFTGITDSAAWHGVGRVLLILGRALDCCEHSREYLLDACGAGNRTDPADVQADTAYLAQYIDPGVARTVTEYWHWIKSGLSSKKTVVQVLSGSALGVRLDALRRSIMDGSDLTHEAAANEAAYHAYRLGKRSQDFVGPAVKMLQEKYSAFLPEISGLQLKAVESMIGALGDKVEAKKGGLRR